MDNTDLLVRRAARALGIPSPDDATRERLVELMQSDDGRAILDMLEGRGPLTPRPSGDRPRPEVRL